MEAFQQRVLDQERALAENIKEVEAYMKSDGFGKLPDHQIQLFRKQLYHMNQYAEILAERASAFPKDQP